LVCGDAKEAVAHITANKRIDVKSGVARHHLQPLPVVPVKLCRKEAMSSTGRCIPTAPWPDVALMRSKLYPIVCL
jgi:hypothetical protein